MNPSVFRLTLDIHDSAAKTLVRVKKGENWRKLVVALQEDGKPYYIANDCTVLFAAKKPDGTIILNTVDSEDGRPSVVYNNIEYVLSEQATAAVGAVHCEFQLVDEQNHLIVSPSFTLIVEDLVYDGSEVQSTSEYDALLQITSLFTRMRDDGKLEIAKGDDGLSPIVEMTPITEGAGGWRMRVTDARGTQTYDIWNGSGGGGTTGMPLSLTVNGVEHVYDGSKPVAVTVPTAIKNPQVLQVTGLASFSYDGSAKKTLNIPAKPATAGTADKVANSVTFKKNGVTSGTYNGSSAATFEVSKSDFVYNAADVGAAEMYTTGNVANGASATVPTGNGLFMLITGHNATASACGMWCGRITSDRGTIAPIGTTSGIAVSVVYPTSGSGAIKIENTTGGTVLYTVIKLQ